MSKKREYLVLPDMLLLAVLGEALSSSRAEKPACDILVIGCGNLLNQKLNRPDVTHLGGFLLCKVSKARETCFDDIDEYCS